jgi:hypothetical protein
MMALSLMAVPVLLDTTTDAPQLFFQWVRMYHYGHQVLPTMSIATFLLYAYVSFRRRSAKKSWAAYLLAGAITVTMVPYTWIVMVPTNNELFRLQKLSEVEPLVKGIAEAKELVVKWSWMHLTRSSMPLAGAVMGTLANLGR